MAPIDTDTKSSIIITVSNALFSHTYLNFDFQNHIAWSVLIYFFDYSIKSSKWIQLFPHRISGIISIRISSSVGRNARAYLTSSPLHSSSALMAFAYWKRKEIMRMINDLMPAEVAKSIRGWFQLVDDWCRKGLRIVSFDWFLSNSIDDW